MEMTDMTEIISRPICRTGWEVVVNVVSRTFMLFGEMKDSPNFAALIRQHLCILARGTVLEVVATCSVSIVYSGVVDLNGAYWNVVERVCT